MSTRIHDALALGRPDTPGLLGQLRQAHDVLLEQVFGLEQEALRRRAVAAHDQRLLDGATSTTSTTDLLLDAWRAEAAERRTWPAGEVWADPHRCHLAVVDDPADGALYAGCFTAHHGHVAALLAAMDGWSDFSWWDNVDQPDDVTDHQWHHRGQVWQRIIDTHGDAPFANAPGVAVGFDDLPVHRLVRDGLWDQAPAAWRLHTLLRHHLATRNSPDGRPDWAAASRHEHAVQAVDATPLAGRLADPLHHDLTRAELDDLLAAHDA